MLLGPSTQGYAHPTIITNHVLGYVYLLDNSVSETTTKYSKILLIFEDKEESNAVV